MRFQIQSLGILATVAFVAASGCASIGDLGKKGALEDAQRRYTELVRWGEIERASVFVDPELQTEYLEYAAAFDGIRFTDFESGALQFREEDDKATVFVVYHAYSLSTLVEKKIRERQEWYREASMSNSWRVRPDLRQIVAGVIGAR